MFSVIVGHFEGFMFFKIIFPAKRSIFAFCMSYIRKLCFTGTIEIFWDIFSASCEVSDFCLCSNAVVTHLKVPSLTFK